MPPRSRTKPGPTTRRPKVAGLRQHAHAGAVGSDVDDPELDDRSPDAPLDEDTGAVATATTTAATPSEDPVEDASPGTATPDRTGTATAAPTDATDGTASATSADAPAEETTTLPAADAETSAEASTDAPAEARTGTAAAAPVPTTGRTRRRAAMTPRADGAGTPTRERPARRDRAETAAPTRTARPLRLGGRKGAAPEPEAGPKRFASARAALSRFAGSRALPVTLVVVIVVCLALSGLAIWKGRQAWTSGPVSNQAVIDVGGTAELVGQSREAVEKIFSYDFTRLDDSVAAARSMSTGQFTDRYLSVFDQTIRTPAQQQQLRQTATVQNIGVVSMRDDRATVMALTQFSAQRTTTGQSTNAPGLLRLEMERVDGRWKLAELTPLTANR